MVYLGNDYDPAWGVIEFEQSETGKNYQSGQYSDSYGSSNYDCSSDYSGWDSSDTDWKSDW